MSMPLGSATGLPDAVVPHGLGVSVHFREPEERDLEMLAAAGFRWVRADFTWEFVEDAPGRYHFAPYRRLLDALEAHELRAVLVLNYSHRRYETERSVRTEEGRAAFAALAGAAAAQFRGRGVLWEIWNEPNRPQFWRPAPSADDYVALARAAAGALRAADPDAPILAPATAGIDTEFIEACCARGLLEVIDAVTVHPYRHAPPESVLTDYAGLRDLLARHTPPGAPPVPILSGEWGYSNWHYGGHPITPEEQSHYLARQFLVNLIASVPLSIWYDWKNDGPDPRETEQNFGTVTHDLRPKPAYVAAATLTHALDGFTFARRLPAELDDDYLLLFRQDGCEKVVAWTAGTPHSIRLPVAPDRVLTTAVDGGIDELTARGGAISVLLSPGPQYLRAPDGGPLLPA
jgi:hypothetical protein